MGLVGRPKAISITSPELSLAGDRSRPSERLGAGSACQAAAGNQRGLQTRTAARAATPEELNLTRQPPLVPPQASAAAAKRARLLPETSFFSRGLGRPPTASPIGSPRRQRDRSTRRSFARSSRLDSASWCASLSSRRVVRRVEPSEARRVPRQRDLTPPTPQLSEDPQSPFSLADSQLPKHLAHLDTTYSGGAAHSATDAGTRVSAAAESASTGLVAHGEPHRLRSTRPSSSRPCRRGEVGRLLRQRDLCGQQLQLVARNWLKLAHQP